ncbi:hypothetical protein L1987_23106 [Smallanthus sonchifolius]|uniref:Uncharacterized protein n=1 Tax=Smallanthus sonchifolius TaxID=185202 RepID=A0ACB9IH95_9ASTR|nr:hypothetical protein L1987_23106 [Smallanthus sonchifolius]
MEGVKFLGDTLDLKSDEEGTLISPPLPAQVYGLENQTHDKVADQPMPIIALASALANASTNHQMDQTEVLQSPDSLKIKVAEPVLRNIEAIKQFMCSSRKNPIVVC